jgi:putative ABC transport system permease protein
MLRHLFKLIWQRKTRNLMLSLEILLAFVIVFAIAAFGTYYHQLYQLPIGFQYQSMWSVKIETHGDGEMKADPHIYDKLRRGLLALPEVEHVAFTRFPVYELSSMSSEFTRPDGSGRVESSTLDVSDDYFAAVGMTLVAGRWFSAADDGAADTPVMINRRLAAQLFPGRNPVGQPFSERDRGGKVHHLYRVSGVIDAFRNQGEYMAPVNFMLTRFVPQASEHSLSAIELKVRPGTTRAFETALNRQLKLIRNDWSYTISPTADSRSSMLRLQLIPLLLLSVIAAFLLLMVGFGLFGVLWQNTTQRIPELGLRRAIGASAADIYRQIVAEQLLLSTVAMLVALALLAQLPLTGALDETLSWSVFGIATALSTGVIYLLSLLCSLYPGWRAARLSPTQALHYE